MNDLSPIVDQIRLFTAQHLPGEMQASAIVAAIILLVAGVGMSVLGAKLSHFGLTSFFVLLGGALGYQFSQVSGAPMPLCALVGAGMVGVVGHLTYRLWVGAFVAVVCSFLVLSAFGYQRVAPHVADFEETRMVAWSPVSGATEFSLPTSEEQQAYLDRTPRMWAQGLWAHVTAQDLHIERHAKSLAITVLVTGLFFGVVAVRWAMILATSLAGTALVTTGIATLFSHFAPGSYQAFFNHPGIMGVACGAFLVTSFALQTALTRKKPSTERAASVKSKAPRE